MEAKGSFGPMLIPWFSNEHIKIFVGEVILMSRTNRSIKVGDTFVSNSGLEYEVVAYSDIPGVRMKHYTVKFVLTGCLTIASHADVKSGEIKDFLNPSVRGVGYIGYSKYELRDIPKTKIERKKYLLWINMLERCYVTTSESYKTHGAKGVTVDPKWLSFKNFREDIHMVDGYDEEGLVGEIEHRGQRLNFDKDKLQLDKPINERIYSKTTCCFITGTENVQLGDNEWRKKDFIVTYPDGTESNERCILGFAKLHGLQDSKIVSCLKGRRKSHGGLKFRYAHEEDCNDYPARE